MDDETRETVTPDRSGSSTPPRRKFSNSENLVLAAKEFWTSKIGIILIVLLGSGSVNTVFKVVGAAPIQSIETSIGQINKTLRKIDDRLLADGIRTEARDKRIGVIEAKQVITTKSILVIQEWKSIHTERHKMEAATYQKRR